MTLTNQEIYTHALNLGKAFADGGQKLPIKVNFYLQKNKKTLMSLGEDIENARMKIVQEYGVPSEGNSNQYIIPPEKVDQANAELVDLFNLTQEVNIYTVDIASLPEDISLTTGQMEAMMFMFD